MRASVVAAPLLALIASSSASAEALRPYPRLGVWKNTVKHADAGQAGQIRALTPVSHILYLNDCKPGGCIVNPGGDDSRTNQSSIAESQRQLSAWSYSDAYWDALVQCVRETYAPFDVQITTEDPGNVPHFEVMIGGRATQLHPDLQGAGGVAPFIDCSTTQDNVISFVFSEEVDDLEFLCGAVAQEATHVWGLDHSMDSRDPMTYLDLGELKRFQNEDRPCGEFENRECFCGGPTQNSTTFFNDRFGPAELLPASVQIVAPLENAWVKPGFPVRAELDSQLSFQSGSLSIDGTPAQTIDNDPIAFNAPTTLAGGTHTVEVSVTDAGNRTVSDSVTVRVMASCSSAAGCDSAFHCLGGFCQPGAAEPGGLGATCTDNAECITGQCGSDGTDRFCTAACDAGEVCPSGFTCLASAGGGVCWPGGEDDGGCATGGSGAGFMFAGLGILALAMRRRRA